MSRGKIIIFLLLLGFVSACSQVEPFVDSRREAGRPRANLYVGSSKPNAPAVCYNPLWTDFEEVQKMADEVCVKNDTGIKATVDRKEYFSCTLVTPVRDFFRCEKEEL